MISYGDFRVGTEAPLSAGQRSPLRALARTLAAECVKFGDAVHTSGPVDYVVRVTESDSLDSVPDPCRRGWFLVAGRTHAIDVVYQADGAEPVSVAFLWDDPWQDQIVQLLAEFRANL